MALHSGVLIIGSLLWDQDPDRQEWRDERLDLSKKRQVCLPIRYGRRSKGKRKNTYTMVLSRLCYRDPAGLGTGWLVPCRNPIKSPEELLEEARRLSVAEGLYGCLWKSWGAVGVLANQVPQQRSKVLMEQVLKAWRQHFGNPGLACEVLTAHAPGERPVLKGGGVLALRWPEFVNPQEMIHVDLLLATPTAPTKNRYPKEAEIAQACIDANYSEYFRRNVLNDIRTRRMPESGGRL